MTTELAKRETCAAESGQRAEPAWLGAIEFAREAAEEAGHVVLGFAVSSDVMALIREDPDVKRARRVLRKPASFPYTVDGYPVTEDSTLPPRTVMAEYEE